MGEVLSREALVRRVAQDRAAGRTIAFANGCFDLLHVGHVRYLESAAREADILVVAINDDESVRRLKGRGRPILEAQHRAELVAALRCVDYVVVNRWPTAVEVILVLKPAVYVKGGEYRGRTTPELEAEARALHGVGGRLAYTDATEMHTTEALRMLG